MVEVDGVILLPTDASDDVVKQLEGKTGVRQAAGGGPVEADTFLAVAFPDDQMQILPYHRVVKDLAGRTPAAFLPAR